MGHILSHLKETRPYKYWVIPLIVIFAFLDFIGTSLIYPLIQILVGSTSQDNQFINFIVVAVKWCGLPFSGPFLSSYIVFILILKAILFVVYRTVTIAISLDFQVRLSERIFTSLFESKYSSLSNELSRIYNAINTQAQQAASTIGIFFLIVQNAIILLGGIILANIISWELFVAFSILSFFVAWLFKLTFSYVFKINKKLTFLIEDLTNNIIQSVSNVRYLKSTGLYIRFFQILQPILAGVRSTQLKFVTLKAVSSAFREPLTICVVLCLLFFGLYIGKSKETVLIQTVIFYRIFSYLLSFFNQIQAFKGQAPNLEYCASLLAELKKNCEKVGDIEYKGLEREINLENVGFAFNNSHLLSDVTLSIGKNEIVVLLGESGSGKTTILNLLTGLLKPVEGSLMVDGMNMKSLDFSSYRPKLGLVTQDSVVFNMSIRENLAMRNPEVTDEYLVEMIKEFGLETIFPEGEIDLDYVVHENASNLSGGQCQRIAFAREVIAMPDILMLDEATSALDDGTKERIVNFIKKLKDKMTVIIATHQKDYIAIADRVYRLKNGGVVSVKGKSISESSEISSGQILPQKA